MSGRIVHMPTRRHSCNVNDYGIMHMDGHDSSVGVAPGTVWECGCGRTFVAQPWQPGEMFPRWQPESRIARWLRERRRRRTLRPRGSGSGPGVYLLDDVDVDELPPSAAIAPKQPDEEQP